MMEKKKKEKRMKEKKKKKKKKKEEQNRNFRIQFSRVWGEVIELWGYILHKNS